MNNTPKDYNHLSHTHCYNQKTPPCGLKGHHCCLCDIVTSGEKPKCPCGSERAILKDGRCINCNLSPKEENDRKWCTDSDCPFLKKLGKELANKIELHVTKLCHSKKECGRLIHASDNSRCANPKPCKLHEDKNHTCSEDCTESNCPYVVRKREKGCDGKCAPDECVCSSISWEEKEREAWGKKFYKDFYKMNLAAIERMVLADYWIERMKAIREEGRKDYIEFGYDAGRAKALEEASKEIKEYRDDLRFIWRWISRLNGDKSHDRPESEWKTYVSCLVNYPGSPYDTKDWYEDDTTSPILSSLQQLKVK